MHSALHKRWLRVSAVVIGSFGPIFFLGSMPETAEAARWSLDLLAWPLDGVERFDAPTTRFLAALTGGFLLGWGVTVWCLAGAAYDAAPNDIRRAVIIGTSAWFVLDSMGSVAAGHPVNVAFNLLILGVGIGPLLFAPKAA